MSQLLYDPPPKLPIIPTRRSAQNDASGHPCCRVCAERGFSKISVHKTPGNDEGKREHKGDFIGNKQQKAGFTIVNPVLAPQVRLELTTLRLTAECSAIELLRIIGIAQTISLCNPFGIRRRPTLPGGYPPSTIGAWRLNCCVRDGNRWDPPAIATGKWVSSYQVRAACALLLLGLAFTRPCSRSAWHCACTP